MSRAVYLTRIDAERNMARYYAITVQQTLFAEWSVVREWGRIGRGGQVRVTDYASQLAAEQAVALLQTAKQKRGYSRLLIA